MASSETEAQPQMLERKNVLGGRLEACSMTPRTGFFRNGCCDTGPQDGGLHVVCTQVTAAFLAYSRAHGNDLSTPRPEYGFQGLKPGDRWCVCGTRWKEAFDAGIAGPVVLAATHEAMLEIASLEDLMLHAVDVS